MWLQVKTHICLSICVIELTLLECQSLKKKIFKLYYLRGVCLLKKNIILNIYFAPLAGFFYTALGF